MKKLISTILIAASLMATPAMARDRHGDFPGSYREWRHDNGRHYDRYDRHRDRRRGSSGGAVVAGILGGIILGAAIADSRDREYRRDRRYDDRRYYDRDYQVFRDDDYCYTEVWRNSYGDTYSRQVCR